MPDARNTLHHWRTFLIVLVFWVVLAVVLDLGVNAIAFMGVAVVAVVTLVALGIETARSRP